MSDDARRERQAKNEARFRSLNDRARAASDLQLNGVADTDAAEDYVCECANDTCTQRMTLTRQEYEAVRSSPILFAVLPGHVVPDIETVVMRTGCFAVVQKNPSERKHAIATDPRS